MKIKNLSFAVLIIFVLSSCTRQIMNFSAIRPEIPVISIDKSQGVKVVGKKSYFLGIGWKIQDAMNNALAQAGEDYDILIDGKVTYIGYPFVGTMKVEGTAISSKTMKTKMGEVDFKNWIKEKKLMYNKQTEIVYSRE